MPPEDTLEAYHYNFLVVGQKNTQAQSAKADKSTLYICVDLPRRCFRFPRKVAFVWPMAARIKHAVLSIYRCVMLCKLVAVRKSISSLHNQDQHGSDEKVAIISKLDACSFAQECFQEMSENIEFSKLNVYNLLSVQMVFLLAKQCI